MDRKREFPERKKGENIFEEVTKAEAVSLYPDNQLDEGMIPRSKAESRAGLDFDGMNEKSKEK